MQSKCCNLCGMPLDEWDVQENYSIHTKVGYGSKYDFCEVRLQLCCRCFDSLVERCAVSPIVGEYDWGEHNDA